MNRSKGSIVFTVLCMNIWLTMLTILLIQIVGLTRYVSVKHMQSYNDDCRFDLLVGIAKRYIHQYKQEGITEGTIFNKDVVLEGIDTFKGKIELVFNKKKYDATITIYVDGRKKTIQKIL